MSEPTEPWVMPEWMERYRSLIHNTGGNSIEELMNDHTTNVFANGPRTIICVAVKSQVALLTDLWEGGHLKAWEQGKMINKAELIQAIRDWHPDA